jgi:hypothetical protein
LQNIVTHKERANMTTGMTDQPLDLVWGAARIGKEIDKTARQAYYLLENGHIRCARKVGDQWVADRKALRAEFRPVAA